LLEEEGRGRLRQALDDWLEENPEVVEASGMNTSRSTAVLEDLLPECCTECFECSGVVGECAACFGHILCGVFHAGRLELPDPGDEASFLRSDYSSVTFRHCEDCDEKRIPQLSAKWEQLFLPLGQNVLPMAYTPGKDVGITEREYSWLLKQCHAKADWQLREYRFSWSGPPHRFMQATEGTC
jgi:hypothetical protein